MAYTVAMKEKLDKIVSEGKASVETALMNIQTEFHDRKDYIVKPSQILYNVNGGLTAAIGDQQTHFTPYSRNQLFAKINMPPRYYDRLVENDMKDLATMNIERLTRKFADDGLMFRTVNGLTKGVMSTSFGRFDASPLFMGFVERCLSAGYVPYKGHNTTNRYQITFLDPNIREVAPNEYLVFTITFTTSDYGAAANSIELGVLRVWCTNLAVGLNLLRKVHIGNRFNSSDAFVQLSDTTHNLDVKTVSSAIKDIVSKSTEMFPALEKSISIVAAEGSTQDHQMTKIMDKVRKEYGKEIADSAKTLYDTQGLEALPEIPGVWRMSNVLSLLAQQQNDDLRLDLQKEAFEVLNIAA